MKLTIFIKRIKFYPDERVQTILINMSNPLNYPNGLQDPNNTSAGSSSAGGAKKIRKTELEGLSGKVQGSTYDDSIPSEKAWYPTAGSSGLTSSTNAPESGYAQGSVKLYDENNTAA